MARFGIGARRRHTLLAVGTGLLTLVGAEGLLRWWDIADPPAFEASADYGYLMRASQSVSTRGHRFRINDAGFRGPDYALHKPEGGVLRVVFLGDSITYGGGGVSDDALFVNRVAAALTDADRGRRVEALNLSAPGWGVQNMAAYVATKGLPDADAVVWIISSVDFRRPKTSLEDYGFPVSKPWSRSMYVVSSVLRSVGQSSAVSVGSARPSDRLEPPSDVLEQNVDTVHRTLAQLKAAGTWCSVVLVPHRGGYGALRADAARFRAAAERFAVPVIDLAEAFQRHQARELFSDGIHLSGLGHQLVADTLAAFLQRSAVMTGFEQHHHR